MRIKSGASTEGLAPEVYFALGFAEALWRLNERGEPTLTSGTDGTHSATSLHYTGRAADLRTRNLSAEVQQQFIGLMRTHLDPLGFDTVLERDHIHCEYDPKAGEVIFKSEVN